LVDLGSNVGQQDLIRLDFEPARKKQAQKGKPIKKNSFAYEEKRKALKRLSDL
jgi:hypothetical protein